MPGLCLFPISGQPSCLSIFSFLPYCSLLSSLSCAVLSHSVVSDSLGPQELWPARLLCPWGFSRQEYWSGLPCPPPGDLLNPGIEPRSPALQVDSLPSEPPGESENTGVGNPSLLQHIFPTKKSNQDLLLCRWILYQLSYQGSPSHFHYHHYETLSLSGKGSLACSRSVWEPSLKYVPIAPFVVAVITLTISLYDN